MTDFLRKVTNWPFCVLKSVDIPKYARKYGKQTKEFQVADILNNTEGLMKFNCSLIQFKKKIQALLGAVILSFCFHFGASHVFAWYL